MGFWNNRQEFDTKRAFRWVAVFNTVAPWAIKSVSKPSLSVSETSHRFMNYTYYYPGRVEWSTIDLSLVDPLSPDATKTVLHMIETAGYNPNFGDTEVTSLPTISKSKAVDALASLQIQQLDADGNKVEVWDLKHPWIKDAKFGNLSYDSDDLMDISVTIRFDWCEVWTKNMSFASTNSTVARTDNFPSNGNL